MSDGGFTTPTQPTSPALAAWAQGPWASAYPVGRHMVDAFPGDWLRVHLFADSHRYPKDVDEEAAAMSLIEGVMRLLFEPEGDLWLFDWAFDEEDDQGEQDVSVWGRHYFWTFNPADHCHGRFNAAAFVESIYDLKLSTLIYDCSSGNAISVYDGGVDCFSTDAASLRRIVADFAHFLPSEA